MGLVRGWQKVPPTTGYFFFSLDKCRGRCVFCPQSGGKSENVSRVNWPEFALEEVLEVLRGTLRIRRVCIQCSDEEGVIETLPVLVDRVRGCTRVPISVSMPPVSRQYMEVLRETGVDVLTIPLDCASQRLFREVKGRSWAKHWEGLRGALDVFGPGRVGTHIIVGLGEEERDVVRMLSRCKKEGIIPSLFAFTPVPGTPLWGKPQPNITSYRRLQLARELIMSGRASERDFDFDDLGRVREILICREVIEDLIEAGDAFMTRGCPSCNRPYFNEKVSGPIYNYPRRLEREEIEEIRRAVLESPEGIKVRGA
ncbi:MAG: radical SAM protein [Candidatus Methanomethylicaceae archaeon]